MSNERNLARRKIAAQIRRLRTEEGNAPDDATKAPIREAIQALEFQRAELIVAAGDEIGAKIDALIEDLQEILNRHQLDAVSAIGRTISALQQGGDES